MKKLIADINLAPSGGFQGPGPLGNPGQEAPLLFNKAISNIIGVLTVVIFIWFTFQLIFGAIRIVVSGGDKAALEAARKQITTGVIGLVVVVAAIFVVELIGSLLGINVLGGASFIPTLMQLNKNP